MGDELKEEDCVVGIANMHLINESSIHGLIGIILWDACEMLVPNWTPARVRAVARLPEAEAASRVPRPGLVS